MTMLEQLRSRIKETVRRKREERELDKAIALLKRKIEAHKFALEMSETDRF